MKFTREIHIDVTVKATLREDDLGVSVTAAAPYGKRTASVTTDQIPEAVRAQVRAALEAARDAVLDEMAEKAIAAAHEARRVAEQYGEEV